MANSPGITRQFMVDMLKGIHALGTTVVRGATTKDTFKIALFYNSASLSPATTATYSAADGEIPNTGDYTAGGKTLDNTVDPAWSSTGGNAAIWTPSGSPSWTGVTINGGGTVGSDAAEIYNSTQGNKVVAILTYGNQQITGGNFQLTMPTNDAATALIRFS